MVAAGPSSRSGVSSILLSAPGYDDDFALWAGPVFAMLETCVGAIQAEEMVGVVCFHPRCEFPRVRTIGAPNPSPRRAASSLTRSISPMRAQT